MFLKKKGNQHKKKPKIYEKWTTKKKKKKKGISENFKPISKYIFYCSEISEMMLIQLICL